jgi:cytochrome c peroxidase
MNRKALAISVILTLVTALYGFTRENKYLLITEKDVVLTIPPRFPKPFYDFNKNKLDPAVFVLGRKLFYDPILSRDSTTSCSGCHQRLFAFAHIDHALSHGINGLIGTRNVPALQNLIWQSSFMWDGGVNNLEVQPINPITNPVEMNESMAHVIQKLRNNAEYAAAFSIAFHDTAINSKQLLQALAQFTGLMISANSRYDKYMAGTDTFSASERSGLDLFRDKCGNCHKEPLFTDNTYRNNGIAPDTALRDMGRGKITGEQADEYKFRVPTLRNIQLTYPYMHDGRFRNLQRVLDHYGDRHNFSRHTAREVRDIGRLSETDKTEIIAFLKTLTDRSFIYDRRFIDPNASMNPNN